MGLSEFDCMKLISTEKADLITLDVGLGDIASQAYSLRPLAVENYNASDPKSGLYYYSNIVVPVGETIDPYTLRRKEVCFAGAGTAESWVLPLSHLMGDLHAINITQCNSVVQNLIQFLGDSCIPNALQSAFNPFGDNTQEICRLCADVGTQAFCTSRDRFAENQGALRCLHEHRNNPETQKRPVAAVVRAQEVMLAINDGWFPKELYQLLCPTQQLSGLWTAPLSEWQTCNWGRIPARLIMTSSRRLDIQPFKDFLTLLIVNFLTNAAPGTPPFNLFSSTEYVVPGENWVQRNLMFSDFTQTLYFPPENQITTFYQWIDPTFLAAKEVLNQCPLPTIRWCVIDYWEMEKCERMSSAFAAKGIKPDLTCILEQTTIDCMRRTRDGFVDMMSAEAGDLFTAGSQFNLVPIVNENYGIGPFYYAVAVVRKVNPDILISNWKFRRTCQSGVGRATGWIIPLNLILKTAQIRVYGQHLIFALSELVSQACIPGIQDQAFNPTGRIPLNLCELCMSGGNDRCQRDNRELYFGEDGAFRCLTEAGQIAFTRHTTVHANTANRKAVYKKALIQKARVTTFATLLNRNPDYWARNLREDDFELLCPDGRRQNVQDWRNCHLGKVPANTIITAPHKTENERLNMWRLLQYGQVYYGDDWNPIFRMFDSGFGHRDLIFSDLTESLTLIPWADQNYTQWLGGEFLRLVQVLKDVGTYGELGIYQPLNGTV
ncbi:Melanotransferrin [Taenia solium]|eukprot:TsM_000830600 transcript=TsM_000830600 gene=TsM_000830600